MAPTEKAKEAFLSMGFRLQLYQHYLLELLSANENEIESPVAETRRAKKAMQRQLERYRRRQRRFMPGAQTIQDVPRNTAKLAHTPILLPSTIPPSQRHKMCIRGLEDTEDRLRVKQTRDTLRATRYAMARLSQMRGVETPREMSVRARARIRVMEKVRQCAQTQFQFAEAALTALRGGSDWFLPLTVQHEREGVLQPIRVDDNM